MTRHPQLQLPTQLQGISQRLNAGTAASKQTSAGITGLQIQELMARIKAKETSALQQDRGALAISNTLAGAQNVTPQAAGLTGATVSPPNALNALQEANTFAVNAGATKDAGAVGTFSRPTALETLKSASLPTAPAFRGVPIGVAASEAGNPTRKATNRVEITDFVDPRTGKSISFASKRKRIAEIQVRQPGNQTGGIPGIGIPFTPGQRATAPAQGTTTAPSKPTKQKAPTGGSVDQQERTAIQTMLDSGFTQEEIQKTLDNTPDGSFLAGYNPDTQSIRYLTVPKLGDQGEV